jgi:TonB family protein
MAKIENAICGFAVASILVSSNFVSATIPQRPAPPIFTAPIAPAEELPVIEPNTLPNCTLELRVDGAAKKSRPAELSYFGNNAGTIIVHLDEAQSTRSTSELLIQADSMWYAAGRATIHRISSADNDPAKLSAPVLNMKIEIESIDAISKSKDITIWDADTAREKLLVKKVKKKAMAKWKSCAATLQASEPNYPLMNSYRRVLPNQSAILKNTSSLITSDDYPSASLQKEESGTTLTRLNIGKYGRVIDCDILSSSGFATLDAAACRALTRRARFVPAGDATGKPISSSWSKSVRWVIPTD